MKLGIEDYPIGEVLRYDGSQNHLVRMLPWYHLVPKDPKKHIAWRLWLRKKCNKGPKWRKDAWRKKIAKMCAEDVLFFINAFCWIEEPREGEEQSGLIAFNTWAHQDPVIAAISHYFGRRHIVVDKSRAQGASWLMLCIFLHRFLFKSRQRLGMGSINSEMADDPDAPESLGWKFDNLWSLLPKWMTLRADGSPKLKRNVSKSTWRNLDNRSTLKAHSATKGIGRGGRYTGYFLDESAFFLPGDDRAAVANLVRTCNGIVMASTPNGMDNEHSDRLDDPYTWLTCILDWKDNPVQNRGRYTTADGRLKIIDVQGYPPGYAPVLDCRERSPWYDVQCVIHKNNMIFIAQELDRDRGGSKGRPFRREVLDQARVTCKEPLHVGKLLYDEFNLIDATWEPGPAFPWKLWRPLVAGQPAAGKYVFGIDISSGTAGDTTSNSSCSIWDETNAEQVAEFAANDAPPVELAKLIFAAAHWFSRGGLPLIVPERNNHGSLFIKTLMELGYWNIFDQAPEEDERPYAKKGKLPGYHTSNTYTLLSPLIQELSKGSITVRSHKMLEEAGEYVYDDKTGKVVYPKSQSARDGSSKGINHGDRAVAAAMAIRGLKDRGALRTIQPKAQPQTRGFGEIGAAKPGSFGHRMRQAELAAKLRRKAVFKF